MEIVNQQQWRLYMIHNTNHYGREILNFAQIWANKMEELMHITGKLDLYIIKESFHVAFTQKGATANQAKIAMEVIHTCWKHGPLFLELLNEISPYNDFDPHDSWSRGNVDSSNKIGQLPNGSTGSNLHNQS